MFIIQPKVVIVNHFLKKFKNIFLRGTIMDLAEHLKTLRKQAKMTQSQVAKAIEISQQDTLIGNKEKNVQVMTIS